MAQSNPTLNVVKKNIKETPSEWRVQYPDLESNYAVGAQIETLLGAPHVNIVETQSSVVMTANEAKQLCQVQLYSSHAARYQIQWTTTHKFLWLEPTDIVTLTRGAVTYTVRILDKQYAGNMIRWTGETEDTSVYAQSGVGSIVAVSLAGVQAIGTTTLMVLDIPLLREIDDYHGVYLAAAGALSGWKGAEVYTSTDGTNYTSSGIAFTRGGAVGVATTVLGDFAVTTSPSAAVAP